MENDFQIRIDLGRKVGEILAQYEALGLLPQSSDGRRETVIALSSERCGDVFRRVEEIGGRANVITGTADCVEIIVFTPDSNIFSDSPKGMPVAPESQLGLLVAFLREQDGPVRVNIQDPALSAELIEPHHGESIPV